jgi:hypothetical protein
MGSEFMSARTTFEISLTRSLSFAQSFEDEMARYEPTNSIEYTLMAGEHATNTDDGHYTCLEEGTNSYVPRGYEPIIASAVPSEDGSPTRKHSSSQIQSTDSDEIAPTSTVDSEKAYEPTIASAAPSEDGSPTRKRSNPQVKPTNNEIAPTSAVNNERTLSTPSPNQEFGRLTSTSSDTVNKIGEQIQSTDNEIAPTSTVDGERAFLTPSPSQESGRLTSTSPNTMNKINEQDPAFLRTVKALQLTDIVLDPPRKQRPYSYASPEKVGAVVLITVGGRSKTSSSNRPQSDGTKKKYINFLDKLRGRRTTS